MEKRKKKVLRELMAEAAASAGSVVASDRTTNKLSFLHAPLSVLAATTPQQQRVG